MSLLNPASIAVVGASAEEKKVGHYVLKNIITQGYTGIVYPVNPKGGEILGKPTFASISAIPGPVDLAVVVTPAKAVNAIAEECGAKGVKTLVVISAGFGELGTEEGRAMEDELAATVKKHGIQLIGPNCLGVLRPSIGMNASFAENLEGEGGVALLSQSGAMVVALLDAASGLGLGFSLVVSMGNKATMDECDFLEICRDDPKTTAIGMYLESVRDGRRFLQLAADVCRTKPVVLIKSGVSKRGSKAVSSHTGALAGSDASVDAACIQTGVRRTRTTEEFMDVLRAVSSQPPLLSQRIAVITNAGGPGILATDGAERSKLTLASLELVNRDALKTALPAAASVANPIDVLGDALAERYETALAACVNDPNIDGIAVVLTPQVMTPELEIARAIVKTMQSRRMMPVVTSFMGEKSIGEAAGFLHKHGIPNYPTPERAVAALASLRPPAATGRKPPSFPSCQVSELARSLLADHKGPLPEDKLTELFALYDLPLPSSDVATSAEEAVTMAESIGYPVVAKISSPEILHKTDIGAVRTNIRTPDELRVAYAEIVKNSRAHMPDATIRGVLVQQFLPAGSEFIVGAIRDASFGHLVMTGMGGIYTELFRDTAFRIAPIDEKEAFDMLTQLRSWKLLLGLRGKAQSDIASLARVIAGVSHLVTDCPSISELDLNPVLVWHDKVVIADAKLVTSDA